MDTFTTAHETITISNNGKTVTSNGSWFSNDYYNAYGSIGIKSSTKNKYKWRLTCKKMINNMLIGIISNRDAYANWEKIDYGYNGYYGCKYNLGKNEEYGIKWSTGDMIEMSVDFGRQEIGYKVNGVEQGIAYRMDHLQSHKTYYLVVSMDTYYKGESIILNDFIIINNEIECKEEKEKKEKEKNEMNKLKKEKEEITNQYEMMLNEAINNQQNQKKQIKNLEKELNENNNKSKQKIINLQRKANEKHQQNEQLNAQNKALQTRIKNIKDGENALKQEINRMREKSEKEKQNQKTQNENVKQEINKVKMENNNLKSEINKLLDDKKEMELEMKELKEENERLNRNNLDYSLWRKWDSKQVFYFIMSSVKDGSLKPYQESIKKEIFESEYTGKDLVEIDKIELKAMGIKNISIRRSVFNAIQKLIQNKPQMDEGDASNVPTAYI